MFIINRIVFILNSIAILALLATYAAPYISPDLLWPVAFLGLAFPAVVLVNVFFIAYWLIFFNMKFLFSLATIVMGWSHITEFVQLNAKKFEQRQDNTINVVTFNARYFGLFDGKGADNEVDLFAEKLDKLSPDVLCIQELTNISVADSNAAFEVFKQKYSTYNRVNIKLQKGRWLCDNIGFLSKYPVINKGVVEHDLSSGNYTIFADLVAYNDTMRIINTHLQSIRFERREYDAVKNIDLEGDAEKVDAYKSIVAKMKYAFVMRAKQTDSIAEFIAQSPYKVIVCGDFNDSPLSYSYRTIKGQMKDAFMEAGSGLGRTYVGAMPSFRIDFILGDPSFMFYNYYAKAFDFSDHKLVSCSVKIK
jgi:endonuclease/exonuclease/phosphatase family metal-dependent hydrolase